MVTIARNQLLPPDFFCQREGFAGEGLGFCPLLAVKGEFRPQPRALVLRIWHVDHVERVRVGRYVVDPIGDPIGDEIGAGDIEVGSGWRRDPEGRVIVTLPDTADSVKISIDGKR